MAKRISSEELDIHDLAKEDTLLEHSKERKGQKREKRERHTERAKGKEETQKGERNFYLVIGAVIGVLLLLIFGYQLVVGKTEVKTIDELHGENLAGRLKPDEGYLYNGFSFVKVNDQWWTRFQRTANGQTYNVQLRYGPRDLEDVSLKGDYVYFLRFNATFVTFDPLGKNLSYVALAASDISQAMVKIFDIATFPACTRQDNISCTDLPIMECAPGKPVIYLKQDALPFVETMGTCIKLHGEGFGLVKAVDRLLLGWYGIMP